MSTGTTDPTIAHERPQQRIDAIIVPLDGSLRAASALPTARLLAERFDAELVLLTVVATNALGEVRADELDQIEATQHGVSRSIVVDADGDVAQAIQDARLGSRQPLICMASHGRGRSAAVLGSVAGDVLRHTHEPMVLVGPDIARQPTGEGVVVCVDATPESLVAIPVAVRWAAMLHEPLTIVTVAETVPPPYEVGTSPAHNFGGRRFGPHGDVDVYLAAIAATVESDVRTVALFDTLSPASGLRFYLRENPSLLVVVSAHGRTGTRRVLHGSEAADIVHVSPAAVLVVPQHDR